MSNNSEQYLFFNESYKEKLRSNLSTMNEAERIAAIFILENEADILSLSVHEMASRCGVSTATIIRLCKHMGYKGFAELKFHIQSETGSSKENLSIAMDDNPSSMKQKSLQFTQFNLKATIDNLDDALLDKAALALSKADNILFTATGSASGVALAAANLFLSNNLKAFFPLDDMTQMRIASSLTKNDVIIAISYDGYIRAVADTLAVAKKAGATVILITSFKGSLASKYADIVLYTNVRNNRNALNYSSTNICQMMIIQLLLVSIWQHKGSQQHGRITELRRYTNLKRYPASTEEVVIPGEDDVKRTNS